MSALSSYKEIIQSDAERLNLNESEKLQIIEAAIREFASTDDIYDLMATSGERNAAINEYISAGAEGPIPRFRTPKITDELLERRNIGGQGFEDLKAGLFPEPSEAASYKVLESRNRDYKQKTEYLELAIGYQDAVDSDDLEQASEIGDRMVEIGDEIYGELDPETYLNIIALTKENAQNFEPLNDRDRQLLDEFLSFLPETGQYQELDVSELSEYLSEVFHEQFGQYLEIIDKNPPGNGKTYTAKERVDIYNKVFTMIEDEGFSHEFQAEIIPDSSTESVDQKRLKIEVGGSRTEPTPAQLKALLGHELIKHALSRIVQENGNSPLLGLGLAGYNATEEGMGKLVEQLINKEDYQETGINYLLIDGLVRGIGKGAEKMDAQQVYEVLWRKLYLFHEPQSPERLAKAVGNEEAAKTEALKTLSRMTRNGTGITKGHIFQKDHCYNYRDELEHIQEIHQNGGPKAASDTLIKYIFSKYNFLKADERETVAKLETTA